MSDELLFVALKVLGQLKERKSMQRQVFARCRPNRPTAGSVRDDSVFRVLRFLTFSAVFNCPRVSITYTPSNFPSMMLQKYINNIYIKYK